jgi:hypothetical protein
MPDKKNEELNEGEMEQAAGGGGASISSSKSANQNMSSWGERSGELVDNGEGDAASGDKGGLGGSPR